MATKRRLDSSVNTTPARIVAGVVLMRVTRTSPDAFVPPPSSMPKFDRTASASSRGTVASRDMALRDIAVFSRLTSSRCMASRSAPGSMTSDLSAVPARRSRSGCFARTLSIAAARAVS